jgi:hypothetical protein
VPRTRFVAEAVVRSARLDMANAIVPNLSAETPEIRAVADGIALSNHDDSVRTGASADATAAPSSLHGLARA